MAALMPSSRRAAPARRLAAAALLAVLALGAGPAMADYYDGLSAFEARDYANAWAQLGPLAESGDPRAQLLVGRMYKDGQGVLQDYVQAHKWLNLAAAAGQPQAGALRDQVVPLMTPQQIAEAQRLAAEWRPQVTVASPPPPSSVAGTSSESGYGGLAPSAGGYLTPGEVRELQQALRERAYYASGVDGIVGPATTAAIRHYQADAGLIVDGQPTLELLEHIRYARPAVRNAAGRVVTSTASTTARAKQPLDHVTGAVPDVSYAFIVSVQEELKKHGFNPGPVDGLHGPRTRRAVERYQARAGLPVDGEITLELLNHLKFVRPAIYASD
jgi:peptidoglycan hydrolase-like protein with peptidoglycan-binding domain